MPAWWTLTGPVGSAQSRRPDRLRRAALDGLSSGGGAHAARRRRARSAAGSSAVCLGARPAGHVRASRSSAAPPGAAHPPSVAPADAQALAPGAAARRRRAWCPTAHEPSTINHYHGCHRRRLRSSSPRPRSDLVPRLSSLQQRRGPRQGVQRRRAGGRSAASYWAVAPAHRAGPLHPEAACGSLPVSPCDPMG